MQSFCNLLLAKKDTYSVMPAVFFMLRMQKFCGSLKTSCKKNSKIFQEFIKKVGTRQKNVIFNEI